MSFLTDAEIKAKELVDRAQEGIEHLGNEAGHLKDDAVEKAHQEEHLRDEAKLAEDKLHSDL